MLGWSSKCCNVNLLSHFAGDNAPFVNARARVHNNIYSALAAVTGGYFGVQMSSANLGTAALNLGWIPNSTYSFKGNAMQITYNGAFIDTTTYPTRNYRHETVANFTGALYRCSVCGDLGAVRPLGAGIFASSSTANGYDLQDNGPDYTAYDIAQGRTRNLRNLPTPADPGNGTKRSIYFTAPDATACTVEWGTSSTPGTGTRVTATLGTLIGGRDQFTNLTSLLTDTTYHYRVYGGGCPVMVSGSFTTDPT